MSTIHFPFGQNIAWQPNPDWIAQSNLQQFMDRHGIASYDELLTRSVEDISWFWDAVMEDLDIRFAHPYSQIVDLSDGAPFRPLVRRRQDEHNPQLPRQVAGIRDRV